MELQNSEIEKKGEIEVDLRVGEGCSA